MLVIIFYLQQSSMMCLLKNVTFKDTQHGNYISCFISNTTIVA